MTSLAQKCLHPQTKQPYMKSLGGGRDNSPEGQQVVRSLPFSPIDPSIADDGDGRAASPTASSASSRTKRIANITSSLTRSIWLSSSRLMGLCRMYGLWTLSLENSRM